MNDRDERIIAGLAEVKAEVSALALHAEKLNGSIAKHFADDLTWQQAHDLREAKATGFRAGILWPLLAVVAVANVAGPLLVRLVLGG